MSPRNVLAIVWWAAFTVIGVWAHRTVPGIDFFASGLILSFQEQSWRRSALLALIWMLLIEGMGSLPFGYGLAWYGLLAVMYFSGRWLFESRSILFMALIGLGLGAFHPALTLGLSSLATLKVPVEPLLIEGGVQVAAFLVIWLAADHFFPKGLRQDARPL